MKPRKNEKRKSSLKVSPTNSFKNKNEKLLARWTDGLFYFVKVNRVSETNKTCSVEFEDKSSAHVHFKDLLEAHDDGDDECHFCGDAKPAPNNNMVTCSNCERVYHQHCHVPWVEDADVNQKFVCRICVFASCAQTGGAKTTGHLAEKFAFMKNSFPYELKCLTWDASHTSNVEQSFCYCGGPGCWYNKMLQCCRCKQWFHEACLQCVREQLLIGDHFYVFACSHCNHGREFLHRMDMKWLDIVYVSLFHLTMTMGTRYVDVEDIVTCVMNRSSSFKLKEILNGHHGSWQAVHEQVLHALRKNNHIFICAAELRKKNTLYGIRERIPRTPSSYSLPGVGEKITRESLQQAPSSSRRVNFSPSKCGASSSHSPVVYISNGIKKALSSRPRPRESKMVRLAHVKSEHNYCTPLKCPDRRHSNCRSDSPSSTSSVSDSVDLGLFDTNNNSPSKQQPAPPRSPMSPSPSSSDLRDSATGNEEKTERETTEGRETNRTRETWGRRSRSVSSSRESKPKKNGVPNTNGKYLQGPKTKKRLILDSPDDKEHDEDETFDSNMDSEKPSPCQSESSECGKRTEKSAFWSLDTVFPPPANFTGANHPFLTEFEQESLRKRRQHFEQELNRLASALKTKSNSFEGNDCKEKGLSTSSAAVDNVFSACLPPPPGVKDISGFQGELRSVVKAKLSLPSTAAKTSSTLTSNGSCTPKRSGVKDLESSACVSDASSRSTDASPERSSSKSRRNLRASPSSADVNSNGKSNTLSSCSSDLSSSPPAPLYVNGVKISPIAFNKLRPSNELLSSSNASSNGSNKSWQTPPSSGSGRSARHQRGTLGGSKDRTLAVKSSPTSSRKVKEEEKAAQKRLTALQRCLKNLTPTCGFHFPVLDQSHPAVASSLDLSPFSLSKDKAGLDTCNEADRVNGGNTNGPHVFCSSPYKSASASCSPSTSHRSQGYSSTSPLQAKSDNDRSNKAEGSFKRGRKRKFEGDDVSDKMAGKKGKNSLSDQENVRRSHRSRITVNKFQAALDGERFMVSSMVNSQAAYHSLADQYDVISLRVGWTGKVEYLIDWGH